MGIWHHVHAVLTDFMLTKYTVYNYELYKLLQKQVAYLIDNLM